MRKIFFVVLAALFLSAPALSQQTNAPEPAPGNLILEVTYCKCAKPGFQMIPNVSPKGAFNWYGAFPRVAGWKQPAGTLPVRAVNVLPRMDGDAVKVRVSVFVGVSSHEKEEFVGEYSIREGGRAVVKELTNFGVEPFELGVVRAAPTAAMLPSIVNKTKSLQVTVEPNSSSLPTFKAIFYNSSTKPVAAFSYETTLNGQRKISGMPQNMLGRPLIPPDTPAEKIIRSSLPPVTASTGQAENAAGDFVLTVKAVIFTDGTYEGDASGAARFRAFSVGRKIQAERISNLLQQAVKNGASVEIMTTLGAQVSGLSENVDEAAIKNLLAEFPSLSETEKADLPLLANAAAQDVKNSLVNEIAAKKKEANLSNEAIAAWLATAGEKYKNWFSALP